MTESNKKIKLIFRRQDFEDIYFKNGQGDIFWGKPVMQYFVIVLVFASIVVISLAYSLFTDLLWGIPIVFLFLLIISLFQYMRQVSPIIKWKKQVVNYLDDLVKIKNQEIILTNEALTTIQDDQVTITKWISFTKATLDNESITLVGNDNYLFPKKSMSINDYKYLEEFISGKVQNGL